jgi:hypothetical protein
MVYFIQFGQCANLVVDRFVKLRRETDLTIHVHPYPPGFNSPPRTVSGPILLTGLAVCATSDGGMTLRTGTSKTGKVQPTRSTALANSCAKN